MADGAVTLNAGSGGSDIDTRTNTGGEHRQVVVLGEGAATSDAIIPGDGTDGLLVNLGTNNDVSLNAGTNAIGKLAANSGVDIGDVDVTSIAAGTNEIGGVFQNATLSATGTTTYYDSDLDETKIAVDAAAVNIYSIAAFNTTAAPLFLQLFNIASASVTVGVTVPTNQYVIPGNADSDGAGFTLTFGVPKAYDTAFTIACTTDSQGSGAPGAGACIVNIEYST